MAEARVFKVQYIGKVQLLPHYELDGISEFLPNGIYEFTDVAVVNRLIESPNFVIMQNKVHKSKEDKTVSDDVKGEAEPKAAE